MGKMKKVLIRHEPVLLYLYIFGIVTAGAFLEIFDGWPIEVFFVALLIESYLVAIHIALRSDILAVFDRNGIEITGKRFIQWQEIERWSYTPSARMVRNRLRIKLSNGEEYEISGFSYLRVTRVMKKYTPKKQSKLSLVWDLLVRGAFILFVVWLFLQIVNHV
jgi:hypothetical protein